MSLRHLEAKDMGLRTPTLVKITVLPLLFILTINIDILSQPFYIIINSNVSITILMSNI